MTVNTQEDPLEPIELRVLGALIEKEITTPDNYPLSMNALVTACNQKSNRHPVMNLDELAVEAAIDNLRQRGFAVRVSADDARVTKYRQTWTQKLRLTRSETAIMCVTMLRGPQTVGELRTRTGRMFEFRDLQQVEEALYGLTERDEGTLVVKLPRQTGFKERRYMHALGDPAARATGVYAADSDADEDVDAPPELDRRPPEESQAILQLRTEVMALRREMAEMRAMVETMHRELHPEEERTGF